MQKMKSLIIHGSRLLTEYKSKHVNCFEKPVFSNPETVVTELVKVSTKMYRHIKIAIIAESCV